MTINFKLNYKTPITPEHEDPMSRSWVGWSPDLTDQEVYEQNRGVWVLGQRARAQRVATFSYEGEVKAVVAIEGIEDAPLLPHRRQKQMIAGRVLGPGDADYEALIGSRVDHHRNPVTYPPTQLRSCGCGCGGDVSGQRSFLPGHDQRAIHERIAKEWGTTLRFVEWFDTEYGRPERATTNGGATAR